MSAPEPGEIELVTAQARAEVDRLRAIEAAEPRTVLLRDAPRRLDAPYAARFGRSATKPLRGDALHDAAVEWSTRGEHPLAAVVGSWLAGIGNPRTRNAYAGDFEAFTGWLADRGLSVLDVTTAVGQAWVADLYRNGAKTSTVKRRLAGTRGFYNHLAREDLLPRNPLDRVDPVLTSDVAEVNASRTTEHTGAITQEQAQLLLDVAGGPRRPDGLGDPCHRALIGLLYQSGLRVFEAVDAGRQHLIPHGTRMVLNVARKRAKGEREPVPVSDGTLAALRAHHHTHAVPADGPLLVRPTIDKDGQPVRTPLARLTRQDAYRIITRYGTAVLGIHLHPHMLRASFITHNLQRGVDVLAVQKAAGHARLETTSLYDRRVTRPDDAVWQLGN
ncbi:Site-specific recombinase XerD (plasmid) [Euzebya pacifica]|uniref:Site-specific recombinase XerD n=1 Tax=Euzebya pacifica TaxID=1608957 RepID=A0A346Y6L9_9ACTN|nr:tyrosine-type recombinase/integrase [Euzebya pacifica]AXV10116.1 Site-specific recombinase XerD [Euzebya pacifica]